MQFLMEAQNILDEIKTETSSLDKRFKSETLIHLLKEFGCDAKGTDTSILKKFIKEHIQDFFQYDVDGFRAKLILLKNIIEALQPNVNARRVILCQYCKMFKDTASEKQQPLYILATKDVLRIARLTNGHVNIGNTLKHLVNNLKNISERLETQSNLLKLNIKKQG